MLTPDDLLAKRKLLNVNEVAYILNISGRQVRNLIHQGVLLCTRCYPLRIPVEDVKKLLADVGFWESKAESELDKKAIQLDNERPKD